MSVSELRKNEDQARLSSRIARSLSFSLAGLVYRQGINGIGYISFHWLMRRMRVSFYFLSILWHAVGTRLCLQSLIFF